MAKLSGRPLVTFITVVCSIAQSLFGYDQGKLAASISLILQVLIDAKVSCPDWWEHQATLLLALSTTLIQH
jgi:hypothetical protein